MENGRQRVKNSTNWWKKYAGRTEITSPYAEKRFQPSQRPFPIDFPRLRKDLPKRSSAVFRGESNKRKRKSKNEDLFQPASNQSPKKCVFALHINVKFADPLNEIQIGWEIFHGWFQNVFHTAGSYLLPFRLCFLLGIRTLTHLFLTRM